MDRPRRISDEAHAHRMAARGPSGHAKGKKHFTETLDGRRVPAFTPAPGSGETIWPNISDHHPDKQPAAVGRRGGGRHALDYHITKKAERVASAFSGGMPGRLTVRGKRGLVSIRLQMKAY